MTLNIRSDAATVDHPIKVYYPFGGKMLMMHWYTDGDRGHVALAATEDKLCAIAKRVFEEHVSEVSVKYVCEIDIVAPSKRLLAAAAKHNDKDGVEEFHRELTIEMRLAMSAGKLLPEPFAACDDYAFSSDEERAYYTSQEEGDYYQDCHAGCVNCDMRVRLVGMTPRELYERYHARWRAAHPAKTYHVKGRPERVASRAGASSDDEILWFAGADFGHHNKGVYLMPIDYAQLDEDYRPAYISENVLFYFRMLRGLPKLEDKLTVMRNDVDEAESQRERSIEAARKAAAKREEMQQADKLVSFFKNG